MVSDAAELDKFAADDLGEGFVLAPHDVQPDLSSLPDAAGAMSTVTNWWVERCLHSKCLVDPTDFVLCKPFDKLSISSASISLLTMHLWADIMQGWRVLQLIPPASRGSNYCMSRRRWRCLVRK